MVSVCAWCRREMGFKEGPQGDITHGICPECYRRFFGKVERESLSEFLEWLGVPVFLVDGDVRVVAANRKAADLVGTEPADLEGAYGGEVIECARSRLPGGCGRTVHCRACTIRNTVTDTFRSGRSHLRIPAVADGRSSEGGHLVRYLISTEKAGEGVLLRIDEVEVEAEPDDGRSE